MDVKDNLFNDETNYRNIMHLPRLFEAELNTLNEEMLFSFNSLEFNGDFNTPNGIDEALNRMEK